LDEEKEDILATAIIELRERLKSNSKEIVLPFHINFSINDVKVIVPQRGDRKKLLDLSLQNVRQYKLDKLKQSEKLNPDQKAIQLLESIKERLQLPKLPMQIECYDNSNIQGSDAEAASVVFIKAKPAKKEYRKYTIKTVKGPDDYASMKEVVRRRYARMIDEELTLPDLIVADGGIGQMEVIRQVVENELKLQIPIAGLAKDAKHRTHEVLIGFPPQAVGLKPTDQLFKFFAGMQDEVHRFAIKFHREKRSKTQTASELDFIPGIGEKTKTDLLKHFKSLKRISLATETDLQNVVGKSSASTIYMYFQSKISR
jgi:excinuclease ABC subunit C